MSINFAKNPVEIRSRKSGKTYTFVRADSIALSETFIVQIAKVCDEPEIYNNVFAAIIKGKRYSEANARVFTALLSEGWKNGNRFDWLILYEEVIVGTIGIKSLDGEIGYWQSNKHPGVMTSAAHTLCRFAKDAGFTHLWAYADKTNSASIKVLVGAGFNLDPDLTAKREDVFGYRINF